SSMVAADRLSTCDLSLPLSLLCIVFPTRYAATSIAAAFLPVFPRLQIMFASVSCFEAKKCRLNLGLHSGTKHPIGPSDPYPYSD
ncbi:MAG: hypothetical protein ACREEJ_14610, partial [Ensifer adhaerens]